MKRLTALLLVCCLLLSGCGTWMDGSYVSIKPHTEQKDDQGQDVDWISNMDQLYDAIRSMVTFGRSEDVFYIRDYGQKTVSVDMRQVEYRIKHEDPIGAYAVESIAYELGVNGGQSTLAVSIDYNHSRAEILRIQKVSGVEMAQKAIFTALNRLTTEQVLLMDHYEETDFAQIVEDYALSEPDVVMEVPAVSVTVYPDQGEQRVIELKYTYQTNRDSLRSMQQLVKRVFSSAELYVSSDETTHEKFAHLYSFLMERFDYQIDTSITPAYSLLRYGVGDSKAFAIVFTAMCRQLGLECLTVSGTRDGEPWFWNIIREDDAYCHVDLLRCAENGEFREYADGEMTGYVWDYLEYPGCDREVIHDPVEPTEITEPPTEPETQSQSEQTEPPTEETQPTTETPTEQTQPEETAAQDPTNETTVETTVETAAE